MTELIHTTSDGYRLSMSLFLDAPASSRAYVYSDSQLTAYHKS